MEHETPIIENYGILASVSWNSNKWAGDPTKEDLKASKYDFVKDKAHMHESLNFGHEKYPTEKDGYFIGYTPMFNRPPADKNSRNVNIVFFISSDYRNSNQKSVIGFYGYPLIGEKFYRSPKHLMYNSYDFGNIKALPKNIIYFDQPIIINQENVRKANLLPSGKLISQQGFNYLHSDNVNNLIILALQFNPHNKKLERFVKEFPLLIEREKETIDFDEFQAIVDGQNADTVSGIEKLERKMKKLKPEVKQRVSSFIERGRIASEVKKLTNFKCLICEALGENPLGFKKANGERYIETHHVEQVSTMKKGVFSINNLITVCANHHRQLHYGDSTIMRQTERHFTFRIDDQLVEVSKIKLSQQLS